MRKKIVGQVTRGMSAQEASWIDVERDAEVELTSEDAAHPIEAALRPGDPGCWRAAEPGPQTIRLFFDGPRRLERIRLVFTERQGPRTQEFVLSWSGDEGRTYHSIVRQQYTFSPPDTIDEVEEYMVQLDGVTTLELLITPDISGGPTRASVAEWTVA